MTCNIVCMCVYQATVPDVPGTISQVHRPISGVFVDFAAVGNPPYEVIEVRSAGTAQLPVRIAGAVARSVVYIDPEPTPPLRVRKVVRMMT